MRTPSRRNAGHQARKRSAKLNDAATPAERALKRALDNLGIAHKQNAIINTAESLSGYYLADFYLPEHRLYIELDGKPHASLKAQWRDKLRDEAIKRAHPDRELVRAWNADVLKDPQQWILATLKTHSSTSQPRQHPGSSPHVETVAEHSAQAEAGGQAKA